MSGRNRKKAKGSGGRSWLESPWLSGLLLLATAAYLGLSLWGGAGPWWRFVTGAAPGDLIVPGHPGGPVGSVLSVGMQVAFGAVWAWAVPGFLAALGIAFWAGRPGVLRPWALRAAVLWLVSAAWIAQPVGPLAPETAVRLGGAVGFTLARGFHGLFGRVGGPIFLTCCLVIGLVLVLRPWLGPVGRFGLRLLRALWEVAVALGRALVWPLAAGRRQWRAAAAARRPRRHEAAAAAPPPAAGPPTTESGPRRQRRLHGLDADAPPPPTAPVAAPEELQLPGAAGEAAFADEAAGPAAPRPKPRKRKRGAPAALPGLELLTPAGPEARTITTAELDTSADLLEETLRSFGVEGEVKDVRPGPVVTTFEFQPGHGIRVNQIVQRSDDLALAMRARSIRMEAPIPGKAAVGIEIPNPSAQMVRLREVLELAGSRQRPPLEVVLGKDVVGRPVSIDIAALPHLLVAGSTGSGKSVCLNAILCNMLLRNQPATLRMVLIDPKMLEMNVYNGIPHLLLPVVTDPREALKALQWMVAQMEYRYRELSKWSVRNIQQYNEKVARGEIVDGEGEVVDEPMPYFLTVVDELADLMLQLGKDLEDLITRLAQKARAVGIHLILATQRPSVDVLTGVIKANIPCRIAFRVIQKNDSRTILDMNGAEALLGHGDMLYLQPGRALPVRVHGSFIDVDECEAVAAHWRQYADVTEEISLNQAPDGSGMHTGEDDLYDEAMKVVVMHQSGSTSLLQRRLRIGYTRAGRLMDMLEEAGIVGPFTGSKAREVLIKAEDLPDPLDDLP